jgi:hypothetical protein
LPGEPLDLLDGGTLRPEHEAVEADLLVEMG